MSIGTDLVDLGFKVLNRVHRTVARVSGGRLFSSGFGMPFVEVHTVGRKSGRPHSAMLTAPIVEDDRVVLVASKGGDDRDPDWFRNVLAHPDIDLTVDGVRRPIRAHRASKAEKEALWPRIVAAYQGYERYQGRTEREIPVVICEPR